MENFTNADILLSIITFVIVLIGIFFAVALFYIIKVLNDLRKIAAMVKEGSEAVRDDARALYHKIKSEKNLLKKILGIFMYTVQKKKVSKRSARKKKAVE